MGRKYDFSGWATRNDIPCSDGRTIRKDAFAHNDGQTVPLVWNHQHNDPTNVLGHACLENRDDGVYAYCSFNDTEMANNAKEQVRHGDITALSIYANQLKQHGGDVLHGAIREVSLVLAGANPGAFIDSVIVHGEMIDEEAIIYSGENLTVFQHSDEEVEEDIAEEQKEVEETEEDKEENLQHAEGENMATGNDRTVKDVFDEFTDEQKNVVYFMIGQALEDAGVTADGEAGGEDPNMKHNIFDDEMYNDTEVLSHSAMEDIFSEAKRCGSLRHAFTNVMGEDATLTHTVTDNAGNDVTYGISNIDYLFPEARNLNDIPEFIKRDQEWVNKVMSGVHQSPFARVKTIFADITMDEARARGYIKGNLKKEEVINLLKRETTPQTVYKKQKFDRDDIVDITSFDVIVWIKNEMKMMLNEEIARAILIGDGRTLEDPDKINPQHIRPVWTDSELFTISALSTLAQSSTFDEKVDAIVDSIIVAQEDYEGSGNTVLYCNKWFLTRALLKRNSIGERVWKSKAELASELMVNDIIPVSVFKNQKRTVDTKERELVGIVVDLNDYNVGTDKGGELNMFDDFDIDYNQFKYLIESRMSGALTRPKSAIAVEMSFQ
ncbi:MAG: HK97 family phage prohead protease [Mogibacterium sp.]|nr:HK97 family phage prohead protease [Mogibacterium sp.]MCF0232931.1 HK97 family phage prohead protease [Enterococcus sp.]